MSEQQGTHFIFMSLTVPTPQGFMTLRRSGAITPPPGATRLDMFEKLRQQVLAEDPSYAEAAVISFDIQPNKL
ncbi:hypothetical protein ACIOD1_12945 [Streptomyces sp. NPDC088097]|uniref:hypothetical protein n=1 Tax=Streptomyces sp. NPDC088097 TaxID=3365823 RepID=UPI003811E28D